MQAYIIRICIHAQDFMMIKQWTINLYLSHKELTKTQKHLLWYKEPTQLTCVPLNLKAR